MAWWKKGLECPECGAGVVPRYEPVANEMSPAVGCLIDIAILVGAAVAAHLTSRSPWAVAIAVVACVLVHIWIVRRVLRRRKHASCCCTRCAARFSRTEAREAFLQRQVDVEEPT